MKAAGIHLGFLVVMACYGLAQETPAKLQAVKVTRAGEDFQIEFSLSRPVKPTVLVTSDPNRLVLDFSNTTTSAVPQRIDVSANGIRAVRFSQYKASPAVARVVVDLDRVLPYVLNTDNGQISLTVKPSAVARARQRQVPAAAASGGFFEVFKRRGQSSPQVSNEDDLKRPIPGTTSKMSTTASSAPSAAHPNKGSLQEGTVFPSLGTPGTGTVPSASGGAPSSAATVGTPQSAPTQQAPTVVTAGSSAATSTSPQSAATQMLAQAAAAVQPVVVAPAAPAVAPLLETKPVEKPVATVTVAPVTGEAAVKPAPGSPIDALAHGPEVTAKQETPSPSPVDGTASTPEGALNEAVSTTQEFSEQSAEAMPVLDPNLKTVFRVKYVADGVAYLDGGRSSGLADGMKLEIKDSDLPLKQGTSVDPADPRVIAELEVTGVADTSSVSDIHSPKRPVKVGDLAYLSTGDVQAVVTQRALSPTRQYPVVVAFTEGDTLDEEVRDEVPRPPMPSVNRARGRIGFDYMGTVSHANGTSSTNSDLGMVMRADITRIGGTYWNLSGYWRGRLSARSSTSQPTLQDLINRTYHLGMFYDNPNSRWVAGFGRLYLPWAPSLDTIDGGYFGAKLSHGATAGFFGGTTPDPTSWSYNPNRRLAGMFINFEGGNYDAFHYTSTSGLGISTLKWTIDRPFVFFENTLSYKRYLSIYDSAQADAPRGNSATPAPGPGLSRNFLTIRVQVHPRVELDFNHNYLRDVPTFDPALVGTGLLDKYLFQGFSAGTRIEVLKQVFVYTSFGESNRSGDAKNSLNQLYGVTFAHLPWWGLRADAHYSRFNSAFADGTYRSISVGKNLNDDFRLDVLVGDQNFTSTLATSQRTKFVTTNFETSFGPRYFLQGGFTVNRSPLQNYNQWMFTFGYRFDNRGKRQ